MSWTTDIEWRSMLNGHLQTCTAWSTSKVCNSLRIHDFSNIQN